MMGAVLNTISKPRLLFCLSLILTIFYIPGILGATIPTGWLLLIIVMPLLLWYCDIELNNINLLGFLFLSYAFISLFWTTNFSIGLFILAQLLSVSCAFILGQNLNSLDNIFKGLAIGLGVSDIVAILQKYFNLDLIFTTYNKVAGLFVNPNIYSEVSAIILIALITLKLWRYIPLAIPGLLLVPSRNALLVAGLFIFFISYKYNKKLAFGLACICSLIGFLIFKDNFNITSLYERLDLWKDTIAGFKFFGNGIGSFEITFPLNATHIDTAIARPRFAHNDLLHLIFELGVGAVFVGMLVIEVLKIKRQERLILYAIGIISLFSFPFHVPVLAFIGCIVAGFISRFDASTGLFRYNSRSILFKRA